MARSTYKAKEFALSGLEGISDKTLEMHFGLYEGYVKNTNLLTEQLLEISRNKKASPTNPSFTEIKRHLGFEFGGMVLHEYYFGGFDAWKADFVAVGGMRGVGWSVLYQDPVTGKLSNYWIELHDVGVPSGF